MVSADEYDKRMRQIGDDFTKTVIDSAIKLAAEVAALDAEAQDVPEHLKKASQDALADRLIKAMDKLEPPGAR